jgi:hypothetical protein
VCLRDLGWRWASYLDELAALILLLSGLVTRLGSFLKLSFLGFHDVNAHLVERSKKVLDLLRSDLLRRQRRIGLLMGDVAARLGGLDYLADRGVRQIEQR